MIQSKTKLALGLALVAQIFTGCANSSFLKSMDLSVSEQGTDSFINLSTQVTMGNIALAAATISIKDPHDPSKELGTISMDTNATGNQTLTLSLDATTILKGDPTLGTTLPNGRALPSAAGLASGQMLGLPVLDYSRVYVGGDLKSSIVVGFALAISAFDSMSVIGNSNIFFQEAFNSSLTGIAGVFTGTTAHESGLAVFARYTAPATPPTTIATANAKSLSPTGIVPMKASGQLAANKFNTVVNEGASENGEKTVYNYFYGKKQVVRPE